MKEIVSIIFKLKIMSKPLFYKCNCNSLPLASATKDWKFLSISVFSFCARNASNVWLICSRITDNTVFKCLSV